MRETRARREYRAERRRVKLEVEYLAIRSDFQNENARVTPGVDWTEKRVQTVRPLRLLLIRYVLSWYLTRVVIEGQGYTLKQCFNFI